MIRWFVRSFIGADLCSQTNKNRMDALTDKGPNEYAKCLDRYATA